MFSIVGVVVVPLRIKYSLINFLQLLVHPHLNQLVVVFVVASPARNRRVVVRIPLFVSLEVLIIDSLLSSGHSVGILPPDVVVAHLVLQLSVVLLLLLLVDTGILVHPCLVAIHLAHCQE